MVTNEDRIKDIYKTYIEDICPLILQIEVIGKKFPIGILNEIRAIFTHLSKYNLSDIATIKEKNLSKAESHIKRSKLDCYKYICIAYDDEYSKFDKRYENTDLSLIDNGDFLNKLKELRKNAVQLLLDARKTDLSIDSDEETNTNEAYEKYEKAYVVYSSAYNLIDDSYINLENLKRKAITKNTITIIIGVVGWIIGILGIIFGFIFR